MCVRVGSKQILYSSFRVLSSPSIKFIPLIEHLKNQMKDPKP